MGWGRSVLSARGRRSVTFRAVSVALGVVTALSGSLSEAMPVASARAAQTNPDSAFRHGRLNAEFPVFVPPTADAGDDQSVPEGSVVTLDATRSKSSNLVTRTYTTSADFAEGTSINLTDVPPDQLRLDDTTEAFEFIWIAASNRGTVVKIDTVTGEVLGEYWSAPQNRAKDPSRTTVDHNGNVWVGNRAETSGVGGVAKGSVTQIGLVENGQCVDRNGNGAIDTSTGLGDIKGWPNASGVDSNGGVETAVDECVLTYVRTNGVAIRQVSVDAENHIWVGGAAQGGSPSFFDRLAPDGTIVRSINMRAPAQTGESGVVVCCYGGLVDPAGILWSSSGSNTLVRIDPSKPNGNADLVRVTNLGRTSYGLGIDPDGFLWQTNWTANTVQRISPAGAVLNLYGTGGASNDRGVAVTDDGDVWVANSGGNTVSRLRNSDGAVLAVITVGSQPTGVAVDAAGRVWASNLSSSTASRINPATNTVDLTVSLGAGAGPYNYSDMTGSTLTGAPDDGTWSVVYDSEAADTAWAFLDWAAQITGDGAITVTVASSADGVTFGPEVAVTDGEEITGLDPGRYLRVTASITRASSGESPVLFDLTIAHAGDRANTLAYQWRLIDIDGPPVFLSATTSPTPSFVAPDDGSYTFELTVTDSAGLSDTDEVTVVITNLAPAVEAEIGAAFARSVTLVSASFTDPGWLDVHSASFDWGDGTPVEAVPVTAQGTGWGTFFGSHVYAAAGTFEVSVTLTDDDGGSTTVDLGQTSVAEPVAVWANSSSAAKTFDWSGGGGSITGRVHSNREVKIAGTQPKSIIGPTEYVTSITVSGPHTVTPVQSTVQPIPVIYSLTDYAPGGTVATQVGSAYYNHAAQCSGGLWDVGSQTLPAGVHYAPCSVKLNGSSINARMTLAATGSIDLSGSNPALEPFHDGLLLLAGASGKKAINVSASSTKFLGIIYAASGEVSLSGGNSTFFCGIFGSTVSASGSNLTLRGSNCGRPDSTISGPLLVPGLELSLAADPAETLPGGDIAYDLEVSNSGSLLIVPGLIGLENVDTAPATITGITYALEYFSVASNTWVPIATLANGTVTLEARANPAAGVTYPAPDEIVGTVVGAGGFATWGYEALVELTPAQVDLLLDPARVSGFRNRVEFTLDPSTVQVRRLFTFGSDFIGALRALSGDITDPSVTFLPPAGDLVTADGTTHPALATLTPGESVALAESFTVPVAAPRTSSETDAGYVARLLVLDGSPLIGSSFALASGGVGRLVAPLVSATTTERLPVVSLATTGPDSMPAGTTAQYDLDLANQGSAAAPNLDLTASAAGDVLVVSGEPAALAAGELATASTTYTAPESDPPADVTIAAEVTWSDAAGNAYGPVGSGQTTQILTAATLSATLVDTLQTDVDGDGFVSPGDTVRYAFAISNHGGQPLTTVIASIAPDANSALVVGSVAASGGTVTSGNGSGDSDVEVTYASIAGGGTATFTFDVTVDDPFPAGTSRLEVAGQVAADGFDPVPTDDPAVLGQANPTRTTVVVPVPNLTASLEGRLQLDPDGNGFPSAGDTLRYELIVASVGSLTVNGIVVTVPTPAGTSVVPGSVTTSTGTVNGGSDVSVVVGSLPFLAAATIQFDLLIANPVPSGLTAISAQGVVASDELPDVLTDDPHTAAIGDATAITIGAGSGGGGGVPGVPGPSIGAVTPTEGTVITEAIDISATLTPPAGETVTAWTVSYHLEGDTNLTQLAAGSGPTVAATIDPTVLPNGAYVIVIRAEGSAGGVSIAETSIVVEGKLKLGRFQITYQDLNVPVGGIPLRILRTYDSFDKSVGDFGVGWQLELANFRVATNGPLGQGGWTMFGCGPGFIFVPLCFESTRPHYVTVTWPDGRVEMFDLTPAQGSTFLSGLTSARFTGRPGATSTLEAVDSSLYFSNGDLLGGFFGSSGIYDPSRFRLTDQVGTVYLLDTELGLMSATDRNGNTVTIDSAGIHSSLGPSITFTRDASGRITKVRAPDDSEIVYTINAQGDLARVTYADGALIDYTYEAGHALDTIVDADGHALRTLEYDAEGRLSALIDGEGNRTEITTDPNTRQQVVTDPAGDLSTVSTFDDRGNLIRRDEISGGVTHTTNFAYDANDQPILRRDSLGHEWTADYDGSDLVEFVDGNGETVRIAYNDSGLPTSWTDPAGNVTTYAYDAAGNLIEERNALGKLETFTYDGDGNRLTRTNAEDGTWTWTYDAAGRRISQEDPAGRRTTWTYDELGNRASQTDDDGHTTSWTYGPVNNLLTETDPAGRTTTWTYDDQHHVESRTEPGGATTTWDYDLTGNVTRTTDPTGRTTDYAYDENSRRISEEAGDGGTVLFGYDGFGRLASTTDPLGRVVENTYDALGRLLTSTNPAGGVTTYTYDAEGKLLTETNPTGDTTTYGYDVLGRRTSITDPLGNTETTAFDPFGRPLVTIHADGTETRQEYDDAGRLVRTVDQDGGITEYGYDPAGRLTSLTDPLDRTTAYEYDAAGRVTAITDPLGRVTSMEYDAAGRLIERKTGAGVTTTFEYNERGQPTAAIDELGNTARTEYDLAGRITREIDPRGKPTVYEYDAAGRLALIRDALGATVEFDYNLAGERTSITDARGKTWSTTYGDLGLPVTETDPLGRSRSIAYDVAGRKIELEDARGIVVSLDYNDAGRLTSISGAGQSITYGYDDVGRRTQTVDATGTTAWTYDGTGDITGVTRPGGSIAYTYDLAGQRTSMTQPQGTVDYTYDGAGWPATLVDWNDQAYGFDYDADGRLLSIQRPGGVRSDYTYDAAGRASTITHAAGPTTLESFSYTYDASGNRIAVTSDAGPETYTYNDRNQLLSASYPGGASVEFTYDPAGNRLSQTTGAGTIAYAYDDAGQLTSAGATAFAYDAAGNRVQAGANSFSWDWLGRLAGANVGGVSSTYASDGDNLRASATVGGQTTNYTWDRAAQVERVVSDGVAGYLHDRDGLLAEVRPSGTTQALRDALGSIRGRTIGTTQNGDVDYDVFGAVRASSGVSGAFGFAGELQDPSGLVYLRARSMDPATGAFLSIDPIRPGGPGVVGYNLYAYVGSNPVSMIDPTGEQAFLERVSLGQLAVIVVGSLLLWWYFQSPAWRDLADCLASACFAPSGTAASSSTTTTIDDVIPRIRFRVPDMSKADEILKTIAKACLASVGAAMLIGVIDSPCAGGIDVFLPGNHVVGPLAGTVSETTQHSFDAIGGGRTPVPHRGINGSPDGWYNSVPPCLGRPLGTSCDEYPYMSTQEGGVGASLRVVDPRYQNKQGGDLSAFYGPFGCNVQVGTQFLVVPVPIPFIPTSRICSP